jgi:hypothetical protein
MNTKEEIKIANKRGFYYEVELHYKPHLGFTIAKYCDSIIGLVELNRLFEPSSDDDLEWECYNELFNEWCDEMKTNLIPICSDYFNKL